MPGIQEKKVYKVKERKTTEQREMRLQEMQENNSNSNSDNNNMSMPPTLNTFNIRIFHNLQEPPTEEIKTAAAATVKCKHALKQSYVRTFKTNNFILG